MVACIRFRVLQCHLRKIAGAILMTFSDLEKGFDYISNSRNEVLGLWCYTRPLRPGHALGSELIING